MRWRGVLFDLFGTVVRPFPLDRHQLALAAAAEEAGLDPTSANDAWEADYRNRVRGKSGAIAEQLLSIAAAEGVVVAPERLRLAVERYVGFTDELMEPTAGAVSTLQRLSRLQVPVGLVSNAAPDFVRAFERSALRPFFRIRMFSCDVGLAKPEPEIYLRAAAALGVGPDEIVFVGDGSDDELAGAARAGLNPVLVEVDTANTYDPHRGAWEGARLKDLADLPHLFADHS